MDEKMKRKFGIYIFVGLLLGAAFGMSLGAGSANPILGIGGARWLARQSAGLSPPLSWKKRKNQVNKLEF
jgi:hypothetical protein